VDGKQVARLSVPRSGEVKLHKKSKLGRLALDALIRKAEIRFSAA